MEAKAETPYYEGDGGKGITLAVLECAGSGIPDNEKWLLPLVQGAFTANIDKFSAITVIDRQNLDTILAEQNRSLSGLYSDEDYISIGKLTNARYILSGSITKTAQNEYLFEAAVSDTETGERRASYPPARCTLAELRSLAAVQDAAEDLLAQLGVRLTAAGKTALHTVKDSSVSAQTALSQGISAQQNGAVAAALSHYYDALSFDTSLTEAQGRLKILSSQVSGGNTGEIIRSEVEKRNAWLDALNECGRFFDEHLLYELVYEENPARRRINYETGLADLSFTIVSYPNSGFKVIKNISQGLTATGKKGEWGLSDWPFSSTLLADDPGESAMTKTMYIKAALISAGETIAEKEIKLVNTVNRNISSTPAGATAVFGNIRIEDIKENVTVKIISVNGVDAETAAGSGYVRISAGTINKKQWPLSRDIMQNIQ
ncbi:hypothetical protein FACS1894147_09850 [Spirochaetia bacterium]|nr:hypothetical protein FACS1894147_09850 [Spirochaetia bacterium]